MQIGIGIYGVGIGNTLVGSASPPVPPAPKVGVPGHYLFPNDGTSSIDTMLDSVSSGLQGFVKRWDWKELETSKDVYDFSEVQSDLTALRDVDMQLAVMIQLRSFKDSEHFLPQYLIDSGYEMHCDENTGYAPKRWEPEVTARLGLLHKAMAEAVDSYTNFEGVTTQETSQGFTSAQLYSNSYTPELYRDALISINADASTYFNQSKVFWFFNFISDNNGYTANVASAAIALGNVIIGGPDVLQDNTGVQTHVSPRYIAFKDVLDTFGSFQNVSYAESDASRGGQLYSMQEQFDYAVNSWQIDYAFWNRRTTGVQQWTPDATDIWSANPSF